MPQPMHLQAENKALPDLSPRLLSAEQWRQAEANHLERALALTANWRKAKAAGEVHEIEDFLFSYYPVRPSRLNRWHPGAGVFLTDDDSEAFTEKLGWRWYSLSDAGSVGLDVSAFMAERGSAVKFIDSLLSRTLLNTANTGCFGLHEWAMVYKETTDTRHILPLRLSGEQTDQVVESHNINCSHFDAFRFFTKDAAPLNRQQPTRQLQISMEQPGCLHANMDLYKWAWKIAPAVPGDLLLDCFELAKDIRYLDMQASPYDVSKFSLPAVKIETAEGKQQYRERQQAFMVRSQKLRQRLLVVTNRLLALQALADNEE